MKLFNTILFVILFLLGISFAILNADAVSFNYYVGESQLPLSLLLMAALFLGALLSTLLNALRLVRLRSTVNQCQKRLALAEKEVANLRAIPLKDQH